MPSVLAIDTSTPVAGFALLISGRSAILRTLESADGHAHKLFPEIDAILAEGGIRAGDVDCFAAAAGPGSFTGIRVALSAIKGLAHATGRPMCAVSNLQALAWFGSGALRAPVIDARREEVYAAVYDADLRIVRDECVLPFEEFAAALPPEAELIRPSQPLVLAVARIAADRFEAGLAVDPAFPDANYIRPPDIREPAR